MANTFTQIHIQCVFAVKFRQSLIQADWQDRLYKYITGIIQNQGHKLIAINGMPDHVHVFLGFRPNQSLSDLVRIVKSDSSEWINKEKLTPSMFRWQEGYGAFSYSRSHVPAVSTYIENQKEHHRTKTFLEEYKEFLEKFEIDYDEQYIFKSPE
jgi:putative transposase